MIYFVRELWAPTQENLKTFGRKDLTSKGKMMESDRYNHEMYEIFDKSEIGKIRNDGRIHVHVHVLI